MSSRFVSGGAIDAATGDAVDLAKVKAEAAATTTTSTLTTPSAPPTTARQAEWAAVEKELEAERQRRAEARKALGSAGGAPEKSLFDVLQANKAAKQAAFEEAHKLKNQFRALDEDEIDFLEGVEADARAEAARVAAETAAGLDAFRAAQTGKAGGSGSDDKGGGDDDNDADVEKLVDDSAWAVAGRKRKRRTDKTDKAGAFPNLKRKGSSSTATEKDKDKDSKETEQPEAKKKGVAAPAPSTTKEKTKAPPPPPPPAVAPKAKPALGLVAYGSDDDDDDEDSD